jgi:hypothetical protein
VHQLTSIKSAGFVPKTVAPKLQQETVALYRDLETDGPIDSLLGRIFVGLGNSVMAALARAGNTQNPKALEVNLRHAEKGARVAIDLAETLRHRARSKNVTVGRVNVEAGGQAIVGNVENKPSNE